MLRAITLLSLLYLVATPAMAVDIDYNELFPAVAQGHSSSELVMKGKSSINGTNGKALDFKSGDLKGNCDGGNCSITGGNVPVLAPALITGRSVKALPQGNIWSSGTYTVDTLTLEKHADITIVGHVQVFVKGNASFENKQSITKAENSSLHVYVLGDISVSGGNDKSELHGYFYAGGTISLKSHASINGRVTSKKLEMTAQSTITDEKQAGIILGQCFFDDFERDELGINDWVTSKSKGNFKPKIINKRFRLTEAQIQQATAISYNRIFPSKDNRFVIEFDQYAYGGNGADGIALVLSDASITALPGAYGGPLGYGLRSGEVGFAGGWLGIGIDEYGNYYREGDKDSNKQGNNKYLKPNIVAIRGAATAELPYNLLTKTTTLAPEIDSKQDGNRPHRYRISVDFETAADKAYITVERRTLAGGDFVTLINAFTVDQGKIPEKLLFSITGSTGSSTNIHEIDNVDICAIQSEDLDAKIDHFRFDYPKKEAQSCTPQTITLQACADSICSQPFTKEPVTVTLASQNGMSWVGGNKVTFTGQTQLALDSTINKATLGVVGSTPQTVQFSNTLCRPVGGVYSNDCTIKFSSEGQVLELVIPDTYANEEVTAKIKALDQCSPFFNDATKEIKFTAEYIEPTQRANKNIQLNLTSDDDTIQIPDAANVDALLKIKFDEAGIGRFKVKYAEAGKIMLNASFKGEGEESAIEMTGNDSFVSVPKQLLIAVESNSVTCEKEVDEHIACSPFMAAAAPFKLNVMARSGGSDPITLQDYVQEIELKHQLVAPLPEEGVLGELRIPGAPETLDTADYIHGQAQQEHQAQSDAISIVNGVNTLTRSISEVGIFNISATPKGSYGGSALVIAPGMSDPIGRFYPARFAMYRAEIAAGHSDPATKSYMEQPFNISFALSALNDMDEITKNYAGSFANATALFKVENAAQKNQLNRTNLGEKNVLLWEKGEASFNRQDVIFKRDQALDGPFDISFDIDVSDGEITPLSPFFDDVGEIHSSCHSRGCDRLRVGKQSFYYARLLATSTQASSQDKASAPLKVQYWDSSKNNWLTFDDDNWTTLTTKQLDFKTMDYDPETRLLTIDSDKEIVVSAGLGIVHAIEKLGLFDKGVSHLNVTAPSIATQINYEVLGLQPWLEYENAATGWIKFGASRGNDTVIYRREQLPLN